MSWSDPYDSFYRDDECDIATKKIRSNVSVGDFIKLNDLFKHVFDEKQKSINTFFCYKEPAFVSDTGSFKANQHVHAIIIAIMPGDTKDLWWYSFLHDGAVWWIPMIHAESIFRNENTYL